MSADELCDDDDLARMISAISGIVESETIDAENDANQLFDDEINNRLPRLLGAMRELQARRWIDPPESAGKIVSTRVDGVLANG